MTVKSKASANDGKKLATLMRKVSLLNTFCGIDGCVVYFDSPSGLLSTWPEEKPHAVSILELGCEKRKQNLTLIALRVPRLSLDVASSSSASTICGNQNSNFSVDKLGSYGDMEFGSSSGMRLVEGLDSLIARIDDLDNKKPIEIEIESQEPEIEIEIEPQVDFPFDDTLWTDFQHLGSALFFPHTSSTSTCLYSINNDCYSYSSSSSSTM